MPGARTTFFRTTAVGIMLLGCLIGNVSANRFITVTNEQGLIDAINKANDRGMEGTAILVRTGFYTFELADENGNALPVITGSVGIFPETDEPVFFDGPGNDTNIRFIEVGKGGFLNMDGFFGEEPVRGRFVIRGFNSTGDGGAVLCMGDRLILGGISFLNNRSDGDGGAVFVEGDCRAEFFGVKFEGNVAGINGGAVGTMDASLSFDGLIFRGNRAQAFGCDLSVEGGEVFGGASEFGRCQEKSVKIENPSGLVRIHNNTFREPAPTGHLNTTGETRSSGNIYEGSDKSVVDKALCNDFGTGAFVSLGYNISGDDSCAMDGPGDQPNTDPLLGEPDEDGISALLPGSPAIDAGPVANAGAAEGACTLQDIRGLGRPQDGDGDGVARCDVGAYEVQSGPDIGPPQSAAFFDTTRDGEGIFVEMLGNGLALIYMFTYAPDGSGQAWILGVGNVVGNSIVVDELQITSGGIFGPGFDPDDVVRKIWGGLALNFPDCEADDSPGVLVLTGNPDLGYEALTVGASRITTILSCPGAKKTAFTNKTGIDTSYSGSWFDPGHDGEGIILEVLDATTVVVQWFTYDDEGNQFWIQGVGTIDGKTITVKEAFYTRGARWGSGFDPDNVERVDWGTIILTFTGCNAGTMEYSSVVVGFGSGTQDMTRITTLAGTACG